MKKWWKLPRRPSGATRLAALGGGLIVIAAVTVTLTAIWPSVSVGVLGTGGGLFYGGIMSPPGQIADFPLPVRNSGSDPVVLEGAELVPLPGYPLPRLVHLGVLTEHDTLVTSGRGWPVWKGLSPTHTYRLRPLHGYIVLPWGLRQRRHMGPLPDMVEYGVLGDRVNTDYWAAGLKITYRFRGKSYTQVLYDGGSDCISNVNLNRSSDVDAFYHKHCAAIDQRANKELERIAP